MANDLTMQGSLTLVRQATPQPVSAELLRACKDELAAFNLSVNVSGLDEKEVYMALDIDPGQWSRMRKGEAHFPLRKLLQFREIVQNNILIEYLAFRTGHELVMLESESQRQLREAREELQRERDRSRLLMEALQGRALT